MPYSPKNMVLYLSGGLLPVWYLLIVVLEGLFDIGDLWWANGEGLDFRGSEGAEVTDRLDVSSSDELPKSTRPASRRESCTAGTGDWWHQTMFLPSPHIGGDLREHSFYRSRAADQGRVDAVCGDGPRLLTHFRDLRDQKASSVCSSYILHYIKKKGNNQLATPFSLFWGPWVGIPTHTTQDQSFSFDLIAYQTFLRTLVTRTAQIPGTQDQQAFSWCCDILDWILTVRVRAQGKKKKKKDLFRFLEQLYTWLRGGGVSGFPGGAGSNTRAAAVDVICSLLLLDGISKRYAPGLQREEKWLWWSCTLNKLTL